MRRRADVPRVERRRKRAELACRLARGNVRMDDAGEEGLPRVGEGVEVDGAAVVRPPLLVRVEEAPVEGGVCEGRGV